MKIYDLYKRFERYLLWLSLIIIALSSYVNIHKIEHIETEHDIIMAKLKYDEEHHNGAVAEHKAFIQHNTDQDEYMAQMTRVYRDDFAAHVKNDKAVEKRLHNLELMVGKCK